MKRRITRARVTFAWSGIASPSAYAQRIAEEIEAGDVSSATVVERIEIVDWRGRAITTWHPNGARPRIPDPLPKAKADERALRFARAAVVREG